MAAEVPGGARRGEGRVGEEPGGGGGGACLVPAPSPPRPSRASLRRPLRPARLPFSRLQSGERGPTQPQRSPARPFPEPLRGEGRGREGRAGHGARARREGEGAGLA